MNNKKVLLSCALAFFLSAPPASFAATTHAAPDLTGFRASEPVRSAPSTCLPEPRFGHTMVTISNTVYMFGGIAETTTMTLRPPAPQNVRLDEIGSYIPGQSVLVNDVCSYIPGPNIWADEKPVGNLPPARVHHASVAYQNKMYVFSGDGNQGMLGDVWVYDPASKEWTEKTSVSPEQPQPRVGHRAVTVGDRIFIYGGKSDSGQDDPYMWSYNPQSGIWTKQAAHPLGERYGHSAANINDRVVIYGGMKQDGTFLDDVWEYDPVTNQWTRRTPEMGNMPNGLRAVNMPSAVRAVNMPPARAFHAVAAQGDRMWILGGRNEAGTGLSDVIEFDLSRNTWTELAPLPAPRTFHAAAAAGWSQTNQILIFGGLSGGQAVADPIIIELGQPAAPTPTETPTKTPEPSATPTNTPAPSPTPTHTPQAAPSAPDDGKSPASPGLCAGSTAGALLMGLAGVYLQRKKRAGLR